LKLNGLGGFATGIRLKTPLLRQAGFKPCFACGASQPPSAINLLVSSCQMSRGVIAVAGTVRKRRGIAGFFRDANNIRITHPLHSLIRIWRMVLANLSYRKEQS
jgi:hypothetical protein